MQQTRITEYKETIMEAGDYPEELEFINNRLQKKIRQGYRKRFLTGLGAFVGAVTLFTAAVNTSTVIAETIYQIPVIGTLAEYVKFDRGLQNAIKNQYVQDVNLEQEANGYTLKMPYVIVDSKRLVLFFQLPESIINQNTFDEYQVILGDSYYKENLNIRSFNYSELKDGSGARSGLQVINIRYDGADVPNDINIPVSLVKLYSEDNYEQLDSEHPTEDSLVVAGECNPTILGSYEFNLHLNSFQEPITTVLNKEVQVLDQTIFLQSVTEYPTGVEIKVTAPNNGDVIISGLQFRGNDKNGNTWEAPEGTIPAVTYSDPTVDLIYYLENDYYNEASLTGLEITGVGMFMKAEQEITIDLLNKTMTPVISNLIINNVRKVGDKAVITFESSVAGLSMRDITSTFYTRYEDLQGNVYHMEDYESVRQTGDKVQSEVSVTWTEDSQVVLRRMKVPVTELENPVSISLHK